MGAGLSRFALAGNRAGGVGDLCTGPFHIVGIPHINLSDAQVMADAAQRGGYTVGTPSHARPIFGVSHKAGCVPTSPPL